MSGEITTTSPALDLTVRCSNLSELRHRIEAGLDFASPERIDAVLSAAISAVKFASEIKALATTKAEEYIREHGPFTANKTRYFIGSKKAAPKCRDTEVAMRRLLEEFDGDLEQVADCLSAGAFKYGTVKSYLESIGKPEIFEELFDTTPKEKLMTEPDDGELQIVNTEFIKKKPAKTAELTPDNH